jgi:outer membrane protein
MTATFRCLMSALLALFLLNGAVFESSAQVAGNKIAVIDMKEVFDQSTRFQNISRQYEASFRSRAELIRQREEALKRDYEDLMEKSSMMEEDAFLARRGELQTKLVELDNLMRENLQELNIEKEEALLPVIEELKVVIEAIAEEEGIVVVLNKRYLVFVDDSVDITQKVVQRLNR